MGAAFNRLKVAKVFCTKCGAEPFQRCKVKGLAHRERYLRAEHEEQVELRNAERNRNEAGRLP